MILSSHLTGMASELLHLRGSRDQRPLLSNWRNLQFFARKQVKCRFFCLTMYSANLMKKDERVFFQISVMPRYSLPVRIVLLLNVNLPDNQNRLLSTRFLTVRLPGASRICMV